MLIVESDYSDSIRFESGRLIKKFSPAVVPQTTLTVQQKTSTVVQL